MTRTRTESIVSADRGLKVSEAAVLLAMSPKTVYKWAAWGLIPCRHYGRNVRFLRSELLRWMDEQKGSDYAVTKRHGT